MMILLAPICSKFDDMLQCRHKNMTYIELSSKSLIGHAYDNVISSAFHWCKRLPHGWLYLEQNKYLVYSKTVLFYAGQLWPKHQLAHCPECHFLHRFSAIMAI